MLLRIIGLVDEMLEFIKMIENTFEIQAKAIMVDGVVVLHEGKFQQKRLGVNIGVTIDANKVLHGRLLPYNT